MLNSIFLFAMPGGFEWIIILLGILLLFGGKKIPELMRGLGKGIREFNDAKDKVKDNLEEGMRKEEEKKYERQNNVNTSTTNPTAQGGSTQN